MNKIEKIEIKSRKDLVVWKALDASTEELAKKVDIVCPTNVDFAIFLDGRQQPGRSNVIDGALVKKRNRKIEVFACSKKEHVFNFGLGILRFDEFESDKKLEYGYYSGFRYLVSDIATLIPELGVEDENWEESEASIQERWQDEFNKLPKQKVTSSVTNCFLRDLENRISKAQASLEEDFKKKCRDKGLMFKGFEEVNANLTNESKEKYEFAIKENERKRELDEKRKISNDEEDD